MTAYHKKQQKILHKKFRLIKLVKNTRAFKIKKSQEKRNPVIHTKFLSLIEKANLAFLNKLFFFYFNGTQFEESDEY
jgi:hypothetical protein